VNQINVTVPANVVTGCFVPVAAVSENIVSNVVTLPVNQGGGVCVDAYAGVNGNQLQAAGGHTTVAYGVLDVAQSPGSNSTTLLTPAAIGDFFQVTTASYSGSGNVSAGGCVLEETLEQSAAKGASFELVPLDAGPITVTGPSGGPVTLTESATAGTYFGEIIPAIGAYTFQGSGGAQVGPFTASATFSNPLPSWTNQEAAATITRSQGLQVTWTGTAPGSYIAIGGSSTGGGVTGSFTCAVPAAAGEFTVPSYILLGLPAGTGTTEADFTASLNSFKASGLDWGVAASIVLFTVSSTYN
jgi:hypothetical protein